MKKTLSVSLLLIFSFNIGGYYIFFNILKQSAHIKLINELDNNQISPDQLIELKIPISLPYPINSEDYKRVNGRFEYKGKIYKLVKQKLANDTLHIFCLVDQVEMKLITDLHKYAKQTNDAPTSRSKQSGQILKNLAKDYNSLENEYYCYPFGKTITMNRPIDDLSITSLSFDVLTPPPKL